MLPPGHIAAGYLVAKSLITFTHPALSSTQVNSLLLWGMFFGFSPDLDMFWVFFKRRRFIDKGENHRKLLPHAPVLWLIVGVGIFFIGRYLQSEYLSYFGLILWLGAWSHFVLDSIHHGVMWLWPFRTDQFRVFHNLLPDTPVASPFVYWWRVVKLYAIHMGPSFYSEIAIIIAALIVYFK
jgi:hypothetical protein